MTTIDRRAMLRAMLGAGVMPVGLASLISVPVKSAPLTFGAGFNLAEASDPGDRLWKRHAGTYYSLMQAQLDN
jgi:hypothetical protein